MDQDSAIGILRNSRFDDSSPETRQLQLQFPSHCVQRLSHLYLPIAMYVGLRVQRPLLAFNIYTSIIRRLMPVLLGNRKIGPLA